jgi:FKBP-type peptidyl-prolyl cis-trans isomerase FklB
MPSRTAYLAFFLLLTLAVPSAGQDKAGRASGARLRTTRERISYALGVEAGQQFRNRSVEVDPEAFARGLRAALTGTGAVLTDVEVQAAIAELQAELKRRQVELRRNEANDARAADDRFLAENALGAEVRRLPSGLQYRVLAAGTGRRPTALDTVECRYRGTLVNGLEFDSSERPSSSPTIVVNQAIAGLREALLLMPLGSRWQIVVPPQLTTGPAASRMSIPPGQVLIYDLELVAIKQAERR